MGSLFTPKVSAPPPPPAPIDFNTKDKISGTKSTIITQPDGSKLQVIEQDLTPEQQQIQDNLKKLADDSLAKYQGLVNDPFLDTMPEYKQQIQTIYDQQLRGLNDSYKGAAKATEEIANRYGQDDSTASNLIRAQNSRDLAGATQQLNADKIGLTNQIRAQEMGNQLQAYGLASGRQDTLLSQSLQTLGLGNQIAMQNAARNDNYQNNLYQGQLMYNQSRNAARAQGMATFGQIVGTAVGAAAGGMSGGMGGFGSTGSARAMPTSSGGLYGGGFSNTTGGRINWYQ